PHHPRLPVALGHRLVLVFPRVRHPEPEDPPFLAETLPAQQLLLEADRPRPPLPYRRQTGSPQGQPAARTSCAGHRGPGRTDRGFHGMVPAGNTDRTDLAVPAAAASNRFG